MAEKKSSDVGQAEVQKKASAELDQGFTGDEVDKTPNANYTVAGVLAGKPTPESERMAGKEAAK